jgi:hypothetical protein
VLQVERRNAKNFDKTKIPSKQPSVFPTFYLKISGVCDVYARKYSFCVLTLLKVPSGSEFGEYFSFLFVFQKEKAKTS